MSYVKTKQEQLTSELQMLTCFQSINSITPITSGLSCFSFKVVADGKEFFAKYIDNDSLGNEIKTAKIAAQHKLTPEIYFYNTHWLVCTFIHGDNLASSKAPVQDKVKTAIKLMAKCHALKIDMIPLDIFDICRGLINGAKEGYYTPQQSLYLQSIVPKLQQLIEPNNLIDADDSTEDVCCHGDLNFSNILVNEKNESWLIDFECSLLAPAEFDIAMFIAVNELDKASLSDVIQQYSNQYNKHCPQRYLNIELVSHYLLFCHFINALWYTNASINHEINDHHDKNQLKGLAKKQWQDFISLVDEVELSLDSSILEECLEHL